MVISEIVIYVYTNFRHQNGKSLRRDFGTKWLLYINFVLCIMVSFLCVSHRAPYIISKVLLPQLFMEIGIAFIIGGIICAVVQIFIDKTKYGVKVQVAEYGERGKYVIIDQGQDQIAGYTNREEGLFKEVPVIIFGDHTRVIKYVDEPFFLGADGVKVLRSKDNNANYKYLYYVLKNAKIPNTGYNRHFKWLKKIHINIF